MYDCANTQLTTSPDNKSLNLSFLIFTEGGGSCSNNLLKVYQKRIILHNKINQVCNAGSKLTAILADSILGISNSN